VARRGLTLIRAGNFADRTSSYRHDLEFADNPLDLDLLERLDYTR
jgi:hypothetical protein